MKEKFEIFKNERIVVNVRSQKQYDAFMKMCEKQGLKWNVWGLQWPGVGLPTKHNVYNHHKKNTCIKLRCLKELSYSNINYFKNNGYKIITFKDFMKEESNQFTKSDLKDNHIVVSGTRKEVWEDVSFKEQYMENLKHEIFGNLTINEVYEFDKLVWKREKQILDEVEKRWLKHFIKSTGIKICWIKKWCGSSGENEYLQIDYDTYYNHNNMFLPIFKKGTMYKNMEIDKEYSIKDLGL